MSDLTGPRQTVLVTCRSGAKDNIIAVAWHTPLSHDPEMYAIVIGKTRFSYGLIRKSGIFCVNFMPAALKKQIVFCGSESGRDVDKFKESGLGKEECEKISCLRIKESLGFLECRVEKTVEAGDHVIFLGNILNSKLKKIDKRLYHIGGNKFTTTVD
jgi:flavin reductase (DIM6/NTAB) family NADH-FMN oxidoreductase RutF